MAYSIVIAGFPTEAEATIAAQMLSAGLGDKVPLSVYVVAEMTEESADAESSTDSVG